MLNVTEMHKSGKSYVTLHYLDITLLFAASSPNYKSFFGFIYKKKLQLL